MLLISLGYQVVISLYAAKGEKSMQIEQKTNPEQARIKNEIFKVVEIEVNNLCNRKCTYCPVSVLSKPPAPHYISGQLFERIISELARIEFSGRISYHLFSEPLLHRNLEKLLEYVSKHLPTAHQILYTNGDLLTQERYTSLKEAGTAQFIVTRHDFTSIPERPQQKVIFPSDLHITSRGMFDIPEPLKLPCYLPSEQIIFTMNGDVLFCYEDAKRTQIMGNILESSIEEIWFSEKYVHLREILKSGTRDKATSVCKNCNNQAHTEPGTCWFAL